MYYSTRFSWTCVRLYVLGICAGEQRRAQKAFCSCQVDFTKDPLV